MSPIDYHALIPIPIPTQCHQKDTRQDPCAGTWSQCVNTDAQRQSFHQPSNPYWWPRFTSSKLHPHFIAPLWNLSGNPGLFITRLSLSFASVSIYKRKSPKRDREGRPREKCVSKAPCRWGDQGPWPGFTPLSTAQQAAWPVPSPAAIKGDDGWPKDTLVVRNREVLFCSWWPRIVRHSKPEISGRKGVTKDYLMCVTRI